MSRPINMLEDEKEMAKFFAIVVRNAMESFHVKNLSDAQMRELNPIIRNAVYTALHAAHWQGRSFSARRFVDYHLRSIPSYWDEPELLAGYREDLEPDMDGADPAAVRADSPEHKTALATVQPMLDRIAATQDIGAPLRSRQAKRIRSALERYAIDRYLKLSAEERQSTDRLGYLEFDLTERTKAIEGREADELADATSSGRVREELKNRAQDEARSSSGQM